MAAAISHVALPDIEHRDLKGCCSQRLAGKSHSAPYGKSRNVPSKFDHPLQQHCWRLQLDSAWPVPPHFALRILILVSRAPAPHSRVTIRPANPTRWQPSHSATMQNCSELCPLLRLWHRVIIRCRFVRREAKAAPPCPRSPAGMLRLQDRRIAMVQAWHEPAVIALLTTHPPRRSYRSDQAGYRHRSFSP
jgi:hypothetical protein